MNIVKIVCANKIMKPASCFSGDPSCVHKDITLYEFKELMEEMAGGGEDRNGGEKNREEVDSKEDYFIRYDKSPLKRRGYRQIIRRTYHQGICLLSLYYTLQFRFYVDVVVVSSLYSSV